MRPNLRDPGEGTHRTALALLLFSGLLLLYTASASLTFHSDDEHILAARAQSLAAWGNLGQTQVFGNARVQELRAQGDAATEVEPGQVVLGAISYRIAQHMGLGGAQGFLLINAFITSLTAVIVFAIVIRVAFDPRTAFLAGVLYGVGTMAWPYATTGYRDPLAGLGWAIALFGWAVILESAKGARRGAWVLAAGLLLSVLAKNTSFALVAPLLVTAVAWAASRAQSSRARQRLVILVVGIALALVLGAMALPARGPLARYGLDYFAFLARHALSGWNWRLALSTLGPFVSPAKSIFLFSPVAVLGVVGLVYWKGPRAWFAVPVLGSTLLLAAIQALFYRELWAGVFGWGLRFMLPALPGLVILAAPILQVAVRPGRRWAAVAVGVLFILGVAIQASAVLVPWLSPYQDWRAQGLDPFQTNAAWDPRFLAIPSQLSHLADVSDWTLVGARLAPIDGGATIGLQIVFVLAGAAALVFALRAARRGGGSGSVVAAFLALALLAPAVVLGAAREDPAWGGGHPEYREASELLQAQANRGDLVLVESYGSPLWAYLLNRWSSPLPWFSLPFDIPGTEAGSVDPWVNDLVSSTPAPHRVWLITSTEAPGYASSAPQALLRERLGAGSEWTFRGEDPTQVFAFP
jgi:hypothetical protein